MSMPKRLKAIQSEICVNGGDALLLYANKHLNEAAACVTLDDIDNIVPMLAVFLREERVLIPKFIEAIAFAMEMPDKKEEPKKWDGGGDHYKSLIDDIPLN